MPRLEIFKDKAGKTIKLGLGKKHEKRNTYTPREEEKRLVNMRKTIHLMFTPLTVTKSDQIVGHLLREISRILKFLLDGGAKISFTLTFTNYRRSPLVQSGLEIPCKITVKFPATIKNHKILGLYEELYCEPKAEEVLGSFLILTTGPVPEASKKPLAKSKTQTK